DLESTNGTRVNGEETQLRILRFGDIIHVGRSVLLYGTREQIAGRLDELKGNGDPTAPQLDSELMKLASVDDSSSEFGANWAENEDFRSTLHIPAPPEVPNGLSPAQAAQFSEILEFLHLRTRSLIHAITAPTDGESAEIPFTQWQDLLDLQSLLAEYLRKMGEPGEE
ncbi:MAG: hypothetical protein KDA37_01940, partial [Planctomycetales bacterium]|nr:hypothetical protein [Planctomycetales bacterium]